MTDGDEKLSRRYRELAREEPSPGLDAAILAASRHAVARPPLSRRWGLPVSIAAVLVLAFGLTLEMQHEKPDVSTSVPATMPSALPPGAAPMQAPEAEEPAPANVPEAKPFPQLKKTEPARKPSSRDKFQPAPAAQGEIESRRGATPPPPPVHAAASAPATPPAAAAQSAPAEARDMAAPAARAPAGVSNYMAPSYAPSSPARAKSATSAAEARIAVSPEQELERIATLRAGGHDAEADRLLEEFRRDHPGYQIPEATWARVKPR